MGQGGQPASYKGIKGDECQCGRRFSIRHCPRCGCSRLYTYAGKRVYTDSNGTDRIVDSLTRCLACSHKFIEAEREFCDAPPFTAALARLKAQRIYEASKSNEFLSPEVVVKAQELAGQEPSLDLKAIAEAEAQVNEPAIDWQTMPANATEEQVQERIAETRRMSAAEIVFRKEWANKKLVGQSLPTVDEYVERRMKGELFE
jgi:hypothetical protein